MDIFSKFDVSRFVGNLRYVGEGMLCIFIVIGAIILSIYAMNKITSNLEKKKEDQ